ncbi:hypothetical protein [Anoxybacteroides amylolyticum]|uniref:Uncharacterized protein n=1 Tax=Anoxybacteroides amylolyticum TaxID=294699 RepID=A0A160F3Z2_9BACL|nr:hypothetical protein [Anoxybacillus amylolyticus]ANB61078.1 hypothetical protein GFC30_2742 [Anoxybacillus amylolyticus]
MNIKDSIHSFIDKIFNPPLTFLDMAIDKLRAVGQITAQGLNVGKYLAIFGDMPTAWQLVISSALMSVVILGSLLIFRSVMRLYYSLKEGVKWW